VLKKEQIPIFIADTMLEVMAGIDWFNDNNDKPKAGYPTEIDIQLSVEGPDNEYHQFWIKVPFRELDTPVPKTEQRT
jgi:hypothetical protein